MWRKQVLSVQSLSILRAEERVRKEIEEKKGKLAEEMKNRVDRFRALQKKSQAKSFDQLVSQKRKIEEKIEKVNFILSFLHSAYILLLQIEKLVTDRKATIIRAQSLNETSAHLRDLIR